MVEKKKKEVQINHNFVQKSEIHIWKTYQQNLFFGFFDCIKQTLLLQIPVKKKKNEQDGAYCPSMEENS